MRCAYAASCFSGSVAARPFPDRAEPSSAARRGTHTLCRPWASSGRLRSSPGCTPSRLASRANSRPAANASWPPSCFAAPVRCAGVGRSGRLDKGRHHDVSEQCGLELRRMKWGVEPLILPMTAMGKYQEVEWRCLPAVLAMSTVADSKP